MLLAFYKPKNVLGSHPIGVMNWVITLVVGLFTLDMVIKTWLVTLFPDTYLEYISTNKKKKERSLVSPLGAEESKGEHNL